MYADFSSDQVNAFLQDLIEQPQSIEVAGVAETFSDDMILAEMELQRFKSCVANGSVFEGRPERIERITRLHPADLI